MRSGSEKIRGSRCVLLTLRLGRPDLTHRFSQPANNEWHSGTAAQCHTCHGVCHLASNRYLFFHRHSSRFFQYILALSLDSSSAVLVGFGVYSLVTILLCQLLREFSHIGTNPHVFHTPRVYFAANILFSFLLFSCLCCEDMVVIMFFCVFVPESRLSPELQSC